MNDMLLVARLLLALVFTTAGLAKLADRGGSRASLGEFGVPAFLARPLVWLLPLFELICAVALIPVMSAWWGASGVLALLLLFSAAIAVSLVRGRRPECHCFGQLHSSPVGWKTLCRNAALGALAVFVLLQGQLNAGASAMNWLVMLAAIAALELWALFQLLHRNGKLLLRLDEIEAKLGAAGEPPAPGLPVNSPAPGFSVKDMEGETVTLETLRERRTPLLLFFSEPGCGACDAALPEVAEWQREHADRLSIIHITRGALQGDGEIAESYAVKETPSAVLVSEGLIASPLAVGIDAIRALVDKAILPPPLKRGDRVPELRLADVNGGTMDVGRLRGQRTLLLFWNPSCGFCEAMLNDVKAWERNRREDAPELLVIASGSPEANREQGFRSRVLLDPDFGAGQVFGTDGTPSAVVIDEEGRVASEVAGGAPDVLALAGAVHSDSLLPA